MVSWVAKHVYATWKRVHREQTNKNITNRGEATTGVGRVWGLGFSIQEILQLPLGWEDWVVFRLAAALLSWLKKTLWYRPEKHCHPDRSGGISSVHCFERFTLQSCMRSFGSLCTLRMTGLNAISPRSHVDPLRSIRARLWVPWFSDQESACLSKASCVNAEKHKPMGPISRLCLGAIWKIDGTEGLIRVLFSLAV